MMDEEVMERMDDGDRDGDGNGNGEGGRKEQSIDDNQKGSNQISRDHRR